MANTKSAAKAARQAEKHRARNVASRSKARSALVDAAAAIASGKKDEAKAGYRAASAAVSSLVNKRLVHRNKAARHQSRLAKRLKAMA